MNKYVAAGYRQISRRYRTVARLPEGKTGKEALRTAARRDVYDVDGWVETLGEEAAASRYLRCYATDRLTLTREEFDAFLKEGGRPA